MYVNICYVSVAIIIVMTYDFKGHTFLACNWLFIVVSFNYSTGLFRDANVFKKWNYNLW